MSLHNQLLPHHGSPDPRTYEVGQIVRGLTTSLKSRDGPVNVLQHSITSNRVSALWLEVTRVRAAAGFSADRPGPGEPYLNIAPDDLLILEDVVYPPQVS